jgi:hypothetical protein
MEQEVFENQIFSYEILIKRISDSYTTAQARAVNAVNTVLLEAYWEIGRYIIEYEQKGSERAKYGKKLLEN